MSTIIIPKLIPILNSINLIDIRSRESYNNNHIPGAKNINYIDLLTNYDKYLNKNERYYFYCQKGMNSHKLCSYLSSLGYDVINVIGGYEAWVLEK